MGTDQEFGGMKRFVLWVWAALVLLLCGVIGAQAQTETATPAPIALTAGQITIGQLNDEQVVYQFDIPANVDMVVRYSADKILLVSYCVQAGTRFICPPGGGGDAPDLPVAGTFYIPSSDALQTIRLSI